MSQDQLPLNNLANPYPATRRDGSKSSYEAADKQSRTVEHLRGHILGIIRGNPGITQDATIRRYQELAQINGWNKSGRSGIQARFSELENQGAIYRDDEPGGKSDAGNRAHRYYYEDNALMRKERAEQIAADKVARNVARFKDPLTDALRAARVAGKFTADEQAQFLTEQGWKK